MSSKFQRPTSDYAGDTALVNRKKYQDDASEVPKVAISSTKIDGDFNYVIDGLNSLDEASGSRASIDDRVSVSLNADGTVKSSLVATIDEWVALSSAVFTRIDDQTFTVDSDVSALFTVGRRLKMVVSGQNLYADVGTATFSGGVTTVVCININDASGGLDIIASAPSGVSYATTVATATGNGQKVFDTLEVNNTTPHIRLRGTSGDFALQQEASNMTIAENTGTESAPIWTKRLEVNSSGLVMPDESISVTKLAIEGSAGDVLTSTGTGAPSYTPAIPTGAIMPFAGTSVPTGYLLCDGSTVNRGTYATLFTAIGEIYGAGDSVSTFEIPDLRGRSVFGVDASAGVLASGLIGEDGGAEIKTTDDHVLTIAEIPAHTHGLLASIGEDTDAKTGTDGLQSGGSSDTNSTGGGLGHNHGFNAMPPYLVMNWIIKT